jgi:hypothetical protein
VLGVVGIEASWRHFAWPRSDPKRGRASTCV